MLKQASRWERGGEKSTSGKRGENADSRRQLKFPHRQVRTVSAATATEPDSAAAVWRTIMDGIILPLARPCLIFIHFGLSRVERTNSNKNNCK